MAVRHLEFQQAGDSVTLLRLGDEFEDENGFRALANKKEITKIAHMLLKEFGDQLEVERNRQSHRRRDTTDEDDRSYRTPQLSRLQSVVNIVDTVLEWLESCAKNADVSLKKQEAVLRGIFHVLDIGNQAGVLALLELGSSFLDISSNKFDTFQSQRNFILNCLKDIEKHKENIEVFVDQACEILDTIIAEKDLDRQKGVQFDNIVRKAHLEISSYRRKLRSAKEKICELSTKMNVIKWFSRGIRFSAWTTSCYCFFWKYKGSDYFGPLFVGSSALSAVLCVSLYPHRAYKFNELLSELDSKHSQLTDSLDDLRERLSSAKDYKDGLMGVRPSAV